METKQCRLAKTNQTQKKKMKKSKVLFCFNHITCIVIIWGILSVLFRYSSLSMGAENAAISPKSVERIQNHFLKRHALLCFSSDQTETS